MSDKKITTKLESIKPQLSAEERLRVWNGIAQHLPTPQPILSPFSFTILIQKTMAPLIVVLMLALGGGGVALASDNAKPGDALYSLDRAMENIHLRLVTDEASRDELTQKLTSERMQELRDIIDEEITLAPSNDAVAIDTASSTATSSALYIDASTYTDTTVVKMEFGGQQFYFETTATDLPGVIAAIAERFPMLTVEQISDAVSLETKDRASRPQDKGVVTLSSAGEERINGAIEALLSFLDETDRGEDKDVLKTILAEVEGITKSAEVKRVKDGVVIGDKDGRLYIRVDDDGDSHVEVRDEDKKVRIEDRDDRVEVEHSSTATSSDQTGFDFSVEAEIFTDTTIVTLEFSGDKVYVETDATSTDGIVAAVLADFPALTKEQVLAELSIHVKSRASRPEDQGLQTSVTTSTTSIRHDDDREDENEHEEEVREENHEVESHNEDDSRDHEEDNHDGEDEHDEEDD